jgi:hypothetical protein
MAGAPFRERAESLPPEAQQDPVSAPQPLPAGCLT